jgi:hypothetical protein
VGRNRLTQELLSSLPAWRNQAIKQQKQVGWEMAVRIEKILCMALRETHERLVEEAVDIFSQGPEGFYR